MANPKEDTLKPRAATDITREVIGQALNHGAPGSTTGLAARTPKAATITPSTTKIRATAPNAKSRKPRQLLEVLEILMRSTVKPVGIMFR